MKSENEYLMHYGKGHDDSPPGRGSGRYPWGSGKKHEKNQKKSNYDLSNKGYDSEYYVNEKGSIADENTPGKTRESNINYWTETSSPNWPDYVNKPTDTMNGTKIMLDAYLGVKGGKFKRSKRFDEYLKEHNAYKEKYKEEDINRLIRLAKDFSRKEWDEGDNPYYVKEHPNPKDRDVFRRGVRVTYSGFKSSNDKLDWDFINQDKAFLAWFYNPKQLRRIRKIKPTANQYDAARVAYEDLFERVKNRKVFS